MQDDEGRDVALKIDRLDSKKCIPETATKSYIEVSFSFFPMDGTGFHCPSTLLGWMELGSTLPSTFWGGWNWVPLSPTHCWGGWNWVPLFPAHSGVDGTGFLSSQHILGWMELGSTLPSTFWGGWNWVPLSPTYKCTIMCVHKHGI